MAHLATRVPTGDAHTGLARGERPNRRYRQPKRETSQGEAVRCAMASFRRFPLAIAALELVLSGSACRTAPVRPTPPRRVLPAQHIEPVSCGSDQKMRVHFFDVAQALSALVELPDGQTVLVDLGDAPNRPGCGRVCGPVHEHLV